MTNFEISWMKRKNPRSFNDMAFIMIAYKRSCWSWIQKSHQVMIGDGEMSIRFVDGRYSQRPYTIIQSLHLSKPQTALDIRFSITTSPLLEDR